MVSRMVTLRGIAYGGSRSLWWCSRSRRRFPHRCMTVAIARPPSGLRQTGENTLLAIGGKLISDRCAKSHWNSNKNPFDWLGHRDSCFYQVERTGRRLNFLWHASGIGKLGCGEGCRAKSLSQNEFASDWCSNVLCKCLAIGTANRATEWPATQANPSKPGAVIGVTQSTESRCINGGIGD